MQIDLYKLAKFVCGIKQYYKLHHNPFLKQQGAKRVAEEEKKVRESNGEECNMLLKNTIEGIIIKWAHQIDEVLKIT